MVILDLSEVLVWMQGHKVNAAILLMKTMNYARKCRFAGTGFSLQWCRRVTQLGRFVCPFRNKIHPLADSDKSETGREHSKPLQLWSWLVHSIPSSD